MSEYGKTEKRISINIRKRAYSCLNKQRMYADREQKKNSVASFLEEDQVENR